MRCQKKREKKGSVLLINITIDDPDLPYNICMRACNPNQLIYILYACEVSHYNGGRSLERYQRTPAVQLDSTCPANRSNNNDNKITFPNKYMRVRIGMLKIIRLDEE